MDQKPWFLNTWVIIRCLGATQSPASLQVFNLWRKGWKSRLLVHLFQKRKHCHFFPKKEEEFSKPLYWKICLTIKIKKSLGSKILTMFDRLSENFFFSGSPITGESEVTQSCPTLCKPMDCSPPGSSSVHGIFQARILEWVVISYYRGSSQPRDQTHISWIKLRSPTLQVDSLPSEPPRNPK